MSVPAPRHIRSILLHMDGTPGSQGRLEAARKIAARSEATLWVMFVAGPTEHPPPLAISDTPAALVETVDWAAASQARSWFDEASAEGSVPMRWLDGLGIDAVAAFHRHALLADLLVLGQHAPDMPPGTAAPADFAESVMIATRQPALVVPRDGVVDHIGRHVVIGWNATPAAAHAVAAALPWLQGARSVHVLEAGGSAEPEPDGLDIARYLRCHGIDATMHFDGACPADDAGDALLRLVPEVSADLLVMGCYGHSRTRELVLGGATRTVLRSMTLPVLMAH